jgi:ribonucleoside-diphosphate reductase alpha chain
LNSEYRWLNELSQQFLEKDYLLSNQTVDDRVHKIADTADSLLPKHLSISSRFIDYMKRGWYSLATPIWTNYGNDRGLPISCYGSRMEDTSESILDTHAEVGMMTKNGGGTSALFSQLRGRGVPIKDNGVSSGSASFARQFETLIQVWSQGCTRRGNFAGYWSIDHPDIMEVLSFRTEGSPIQDMSYGVCVKDQWMQEMIDGDSEKRKVWAKVIQSRMNTGYPYIFFTDNVNAGLPDCYIDKYTVDHSNLCTEIMLPTSITEAFVCCVSSLNILYFDEWKNTDAPEVFVTFLDTVLTDFINRAKKIKHMQRAVRFAERHRAIGIGQLGWHSYLQSKLIPFESMEAKQENLKIAKTIHKAVHKATKKLAEELGEPEVCKGFNSRNSTLLAIAPTKSSSFILEQVSENIEPNRSNYFIKDLAKGKFTIKNKYLQEVLKSKNKDTEEVWESILKNSGSVQHLKCLTKHEKEVFKTFSEISPMEILQQVAQRQKYIDQGQSLNILIDPKTPIKEVNALLIEGWKLGIKSYYYQISANAAQQLSRSILACTNCES